jgi:hypothetical protein
VLVRLQVLGVCVCSEAREDAMLQWKRTRLCLFSVEFLVALVSLRILPVAEGQSCTVISDVDPPSGSRQTRFAILGDNLDQLGSITVIQLINDAEIDILGTTNVTQTRIEFTVNPQTSSLATITIDPDEEDCGSASVEIFVVFIVSFANLLGELQTVQPGTVLATSGACLPPVCGDNSTNYEVVLAGNTLQELQANSFEFIVRLPDTDTDYDNVELFIQTLYSQLSTTAKVNFRRSPSIDSISPDTGQRGTRVVIEGENLLGFGHGTIEFSQVSIGGTNAMIDPRSNSTHIFARVLSGIAGSNSVAVNTTQRINGVEYDGPYTSSVSRWTQLEDGLVSEIIPPAAKINATINLCGERLLGGGASVADITIAEQQVEIFGDLVLSGGLSECIEIRVPNVSNPENATGGVTIESDAGAIVESSSNIIFTYAVITDVTPSSGQVGTEVTISGIGLLSGYADLTPSVFLADVEATLLTSSPERIVVRVQDPSTSGSGGSEFMNITGDTVITVTRDSSEFSVSLADSWEYLEPGVIELVQPVFGQFGTRITLTGTNLLGYGSSLREARVDGVTAVIVSQTNNEVVIEAPDIETLGRVSIVLEANNRALVRLDDAFEFRERGVVLDLDPPSGQNGTFVSISGSNLFGHATSINSITFGGVEADIDSTNSNNSVIRVRVQPNDVTVDTPVRVVITAGTMARVSTSGEDWTYLVPGAVSGVEPDTGQTGTVVTITGTNLLGGGRSVQSILLDGVSATVTEATPTSITVSMDDLSQQIEFYRGTVHIVANTGAVVVGGAYNHRESGEITNFVPTMGQEGTRITITGTNLPGYGARVTEVMIAGVRGEIVEQISTSLVVVRAGAAASGTVGQISLTSDTGAFITSPGALVFTYTEQGSIDDVNPSEGAEGSGVLIQGTFLRPSGTVVTSVTIGGSPVLRIVTESQSEVAVVVGAAPANGGNNSIIVITANDGSIVRGGNFTYLDLTLSLLDVDRGQQGTQVIIRLPNDNAFDPTFPLVARIGGQIAATLSSSVSNQTIEVSTPRAGEVGTYSVDVTVEGIDGRVARLRNGFTYIEEGVVFSATPDRGQQGTRIQVVGRNLLGGGSTIASARIGQRGGREVSANVRDSDDENVDLEILSNFPLDSVFPITADITLVADTGATIVGVGLFNLVQPGQITGVSPTRGQFGTRVTITGTNLLQGGTVADIYSITLAGTDVDEILGIPTDIEITVRARSSPEGPPGSVIITLTTGATIIPPESITFQYLSPGVINSVTPEIGTVGTRVTISGENLLGGGVVQEVTLGGVPAEIIATPTNSQIIVRAQLPEVNGSGDAANRSGAVEILIDTGAVISGEEWEFEELGVISSINPPVGQQGATVTIRGVSLLGSSAGEFTSCSLAGIQGTVTLSTETEAECVAGFNPFAANDSNPDLLSGPVQLIADSGPVIVSEEQQFTYYAARIDAIEPMNGTNGTYVNIVGINLNGSAGSGEIDDVDSVRFGSIPATAIEVLTENSIRVRVGASAVDSDLAVRIELESGAFLELEGAWDYTEPGEISNVSPTTAQPGETVTIYGRDLVPPCVSEVRVIVGQTRSYEATIVNSSELTFRAGPYQASVVGSDSNLDEPGIPLPIQVIASNGATVYNSAGLFTYSESEARVTSISPVAGSGGTMVTITGINLLHGNSTAVEVTLAGQNATIMSASDTEVIVIAGDGHAEGARGRIIIESDVGLISGIGTDVWEYLPDITADDVTPVTGQNGTRVSIDLKGISLVITRISLAGVEVNGIVDKLGTRVIVEAGPSPQTPEGDITVNFMNGASLTIPSAWSYLEPAELEFFMPTIGYFNTEIRILVSNLRAGNRSVESVQVSGIATEVLSQNDSEVGVRVSEFRDSSAGSIEGPFTIIWEDGATYTSNGVVFTYVRLEVRNVTPRSGQGGTIVSITGEGLLAGSSQLEEARLGGIPVQSLSMVSDTRIDLVASPSTEGTSAGSITYMVAGGGRVVIDDAWTYLEPGEVREVSPLQGVQGSYVTIRGERMLQGGSSVSQVTVAGVDAMEIVVGLDDIIQVRLGLTPSLPQGAITIISDTGATLSNDAFVFQYLASGSITGASPDSGQNGTRVVISGTGFTEVVRVTLAGVEVNVLGEVNDTSITVEAGRPDIFEGFSGRIIIETDSGAIITGDPTFTYNQEGVIYTAYPSQGQVGTRVVISGERLLGDGARVDKAYLAGIEATVNSSSADSVILIASLLLNSDNITTGDIVLVSETGAYVRKIDGWSYVMTGAVVDIDPPRGQFGTRVTITGTGLLSGGESVARITVGDIATTTDITFSSDTRVDARMGEPISPNPSGDRVTLISNFGGELRSTFTWNYLEASTEIEVSPNSGVGGVVVNVTGERLLGGGSRIDTVTTAGVPAENIDQGASNDGMVVFTVGYHPTGAAVRGDVVIESDTGALTIIDDGWEYNDACPQGQFGSFGNCTNCSEVCVTCNGATNEDCLECRNFAVPLSVSNMRCVERCPNVSTLDNVCVDACNSNQYSRTDSKLDTVFCYDCNELCNPRLGCTGPNATECTACEVAFDQNSQACVADCGVGTWLREDRVCVPCDSQCNATAGCFGETSSDCYECLNVRISLSSAESGELDDQMISDVCLEECPTGFYEDGDRNCLQCSEQCLGGCTGPSAFDCRECATVARIQDGQELCVPSCNSGSTQMTLFETSDRSCGVCSRLCSLEDGCRGATDADCITCRRNATTNTTLPRFEGACGLSCPNITYYHDTMTGACELCDSSCTNGCLGPSPADCTQEPQVEESSIFSAGSGTIGLTVAITLVLAVALVVLVALIFVSLARRRRGYKLNLHGGDAERDVELEVRYSRRPNDVASATPTKIPLAESATVSADDEYTQMAPTEPLAPTLKRNQQSNTAVHVEEKKYQPVSKSQGSGATMIENEGALYSAAGPEEESTPPPRPAKPVKEKTKPVKDKPKPASAKGRKTSKSSESGTAPPPVIATKPPSQPPIASPSKTSVPEKKPAPPPPLTDLDGEMYTEMTASIQEVYVQPDLGPTEEYTEMAHISREEDQLYEDTAGSEPVSPQKSTSDTAPLIDEALYEDTDSTVMGSDYQRIKQNLSTTSLPIRAAPAGHKPLPRPRSAQPLPQTPLEISLHGVKPPSIAEVLYEETEANAPPTEEILYEAIVMPNRPLSDEPSPELAPKERVGKGSTNPPLPPKGRK